jgi:hypothetical protein
MADDANDKNFDVNWALGVLAKTGTPNDRKIQQIIDLQKAYGADLQPDMAAFARGEDPLAGGTA